MTGLASPVETIAAEFNEAERRAAQARDEARQAADRLIREPYPDRQLARDQATNTVELVELEVERLRRALREAQIEACRERLTEIAIEHSDDLAKLGPIWDQIHAGVAQIEAALDEFQPMKVRAQGRTHRAREAHFARGGETHNQPTYLIALPRSGELNDRLDRIKRKLTRASL
jgi:hypothetical protein